MKIVSNRSVDLSFLKSPSRVIPSPESRAKQIVGHSSQALSVPSQVLLVKTTTSEVAEVEGLSSNLLTSES